MARKGRTFGCALLGTLLLISSCTREKRSEDLAGAVFPDAPVILISVDTLRSDHLPAYGYKGVETPNLDRFRKDAILFEQAFSHCPLTFPSHVTMLTGLLPGSSGVRDNIGFRFDAAAQPTLPGTLHSKGYRTGAAVSSYVLRGKTGLGAAFDFYDDAVEVRPGSAQGNLQRSGSETAAIARRWIEQNHNQPFFFLMHLFEPHAPYAPPPPFAGRYPMAYDGEIAAVDQIVGELLDTLRTSGIYEKAIVIVVSDHGEGLMDHGEQEHGIFLYREAIQVPLLVKLPGSRDGGKSMSEPVGLVDLFPTIARLVGATVPPKLDGSSLFDAPSKPRTIFSETVYPRVHLGWSELRSLIGGGHHFIDAPRAELYDLKSDPREATNILGEQRRVAASMREAMRPLTVPIAAPQNIDPEEAQKLAALGYLSSSTPAAGGPLPDPKDRIGEIALMREGAQLTQARRFGEAIAKLKTVLAANPRLSDAWSLLAKCYEEAEDYQNAVAAYRKTIELSPTSSGDTALTLGSVLLRMNRLEEAESHAQLGMRTNPASAQLLLGRVALARKDMTGAEQQAKAAMEDNLYRLPAAVLLAQALNGQNKPAEALVLAEKTAGEIAARGYEPVAMLDFARGDALARLNRLDEAAGAFQSEIRHFPHGRQAYANLTVVYAIQGQNNEARRTMEAMVTANPGPESYRVAAETFEELGAADEAARWRRRGMR
jgi:arylsulfatase A-like enzyme/tetratricopeptide (TPR) repeat protein